MSGQVQSVLNLVDSFLTDFENKEAAIQERSYTETLSGPAELEKPSGSEVVTEQRGLGKEQTEEARNGGANTDSVPENKDADGNSPVDDQGPDTLDTDEKLKSRSEVLGTTRTQEITQEQKVARATNMGNAILAIAAQAMEKEAACSCKGKAGKGKCPDCGMAYKKATLELPPRVAPEQPATGLNKEAADFLKYAEPVAQAAAEKYYWDFLEGMHKRAQDERQVASANIPAEVLEACGGVPGLLDKVAMEYPDAVMPEGVDMAEGEDGEGGEGGEGGQAPEAPLPEAGGEDPMAALAGGGEDPMAALGGGGEEAALGGEGLGGGEDIDQLAGALDEAGVTPEDLEQAFADVEALREAGVQPEELAAALEEIATESGGEAAALEGAPDAPIDKAASMDKVARQRIDAIKEYLTSER
jgi:hypothetical protein